MKRIILATALMSVSLLGFGQLGTDSSILNPNIPETNPAQSSTEPGTIDDQILQYGNPSLNGPGNGNGNGNGNGIGNGQGNGLDNNPNAPIDPGPDPGIPVDGGILLLAAAGTAFGARKAWKQKQAKTDKAA